MAANKDDNKILNAIRLHLVLLNVANEASKFKLAQLIRTYERTSVKAFLISVSRSGNEHLKGFIKTLANNCDIRNENSFPDDLKAFDISACSALSRNCLQFPYEIEEKIKQNDPKNPNSVKDFLTLHYNYYTNPNNNYNIQNRPKHPLFDFVGSLSYNFRNRRLAFPNNLNDRNVFNSPVCYSMSKNLLNIRNYFDELSEIRNKYYGHLNLLEFEDADYKSVLAHLKYIIDDFTQSEPQYQQELRERIKKIEAIQALSSISLADRNNLKEIILDLSLNIRDMFAQNGQVKIDIDAFIATSKQFQESHATKIDEIRQLSFELKKWSESIKNQNISQEEMDKIAEVVSAHLNRKLNFEETLKPYFEDVKSHVSNVATAQTNEILTRVESKLQPLIKAHSRPNLGMLFFLHK